MAQEPAAFASGVFALYNKPNLLSASRTQDEPRYYVTRKNFKEPTEGPAPGKEPARARIDLFGRVSLSIYLLSFDC